MSASSCSRSANPVPSRPASTWANRGAAVAGPPGPHVSVEHGVGQSRPVVAVPASNRGSDRHLHVGVRHHIRLTGRVEERPRPRVERDRIEEHHRVDAQVVQRQQLRDASAHAVTDDREPIDAEVREQRGDGLGLRSKVQADTFGSPSNRRSRTGQER